MHRFWNGIAAAAMWMSDKAEARAEGDLARAREDVDASDWWSDVQAWADGLGTWRELRAKRQRLASTGKG